MQLKVLTDRHHASIEKAAAVVGIGRKNIVELPVTSDGTGMVEFADLVEEELLKYQQSQPSGMKYAVIVVVSFAEVNTVSSLFGIQFHKLPAANIRH